MYLYDFSHDVNYNRLRNISVKSPEARLSYTKRFLSLLSENEKLKLNTNDINIRFDSNFLKCKYIENEENLAGPCWEVKIDRENDMLLFLIDSKELYRSVIKQEPTLEKLYYYITFLKTNDISGLKDALNV